MRLFVLPASTALAALMTLGGCARLASGDEAHDAMPRSQTPLLAQSLAPDAPPTDASGWQTLARSHAAQGLHAQAVIAFRHAARLRPDDATLLAEYAFSAAATSQRTSADEPQQLVERALRLDPSNPQALALAGTLAVDRGDYGAATQHWERLAQLEPPDSATQRELHASIAQTRQLASAQAGRIELARAH